MWKGLLFITEAILVGAQQRNTSISEKLKVNFFKLDSKYIVFANNNLIILENYKFTA